MTVEELAHIADACRKKQREHFSTRSATVLAECRDLERRLDKLLDIILRPGTPDLFGEQP